MLDIHTHLYFPDYDLDREETIKRAFDAGITMMISVGTEPKDHHKALAITELDERIFASVGLHPHYFNEWFKYDDKEKEPQIFRTGSSRVRQCSLSENPDSFSSDDMIEAVLIAEIDVLRTLAKENPKIIAIGECGLDYFSHTREAITDEQKAWQKKGFIAQIRLAQELHLPMIIHCRDAYDDLFEILRRSGFATRSGGLRSESKDKVHSTTINLRDLEMFGQEGGDTIFILHCYMGDTEVTKKFLTLPNVYFSFTGNITYPVKKALEGAKDDIRETVKMIPLEKMFAETDCPFLAPVPYRGKRNEPRFVVEVAKKITKIKGCSQAIFEGAVRGSVKKVFHLDR